MNKQIITVWVIVLIVLAAFISIYLTMRWRTKDLTPPQNYSQLSRLEQVQPLYFKQPLDEDAGRKNVNEYRKNLSMRSNGVIYDAGVILNYLNNIYPQLKKQMAKDTTGYTWKIGFYWMISKGKDSTNRLGFCVVPTLVSKTDSTKHIDYFTDSLIYQRAGMVNSQNRPPNDDPPPGYIYDEGQLWP